MADSDQEEKTHEPTQKKLDDAREKGDVPISGEVRHAIMLVAALVVLGGMGATMLARLAVLFTRTWGQAGELRLTPDGAQQLAGGILGEAGWAMAPVLGLFADAALLTWFVQGPPTVSAARVRPKWSKLNPLSGLSRLFGKRALIEFAKTLAKLIAVGVVAMVALWPHIAGLDQLIGSGPERIGAVASGLSVQMVRTVALLVVALALFDIVYQRRAFIARLRMTFNEVRDEMKQAEGDPAIKARIRAIGMQRSRKRMMAQVPNASVIVTNPTHYAVALKYDHGEMAAPVIVAKGVDKLALKIREIASEAGVPIVESPPLARALYATVDVDRPIPVEHYVAVAEIIGFVMKMAGRKTRRQ